jgi:hypothetical protein
LRRVHSDQPLQCPRCTRTDFRNAEELQAHQTAPEPCNLVSPIAVKRIKWISDDARVALQRRVNQESAGLRNLRDCTEKDRWGFAYRWLFPPTTPEDTPCPCKYSRIGPNSRLLTVVDMRDPVISIVSFVVDSYGTRLRQLIRQSDDLEDLAGRVRAIREQLLSQYSILDHESEQRALLPLSATTIHGETGLERSTSLSPLDVDEPCGSDPRSQDHGHRAVLLPVYRTHGSISSPETSSTSCIPQATSFWSQPQSTAPSHQATGAYYNHTDVSYPHTLINLFSPGTSTEGPYQASTASPSQDHRISSSLNSRERQPLYQQTQVVTAPQNYDASPIQDTSQSLGTRTDMLDDLWTYDFSNMDTWANPFPSNSFGP